MGDSDSRFSIRFQGVTLLGRYLVGEQLGAGGMATVYLGLDTQLEMQIVVKVPHGALLAERGFRDRFQKEIQDLVALQHPHIVTILARGEHDEVPYLVQQFIDGGSLDDRLERAPGRRLGLADIRPWLRDVARALDFMHVRGVVHRDVKPANVLLDSHGNVYLSDFGIAKAMGAADTGLTLTGAAPGSPTYMAPEQAMAKPLAGAADQYALASTVFEVLTGRPPFEGQNLLDVLVRKQGQEAPSASALVPETPPSVDAALARALARDPDMRFDSCEAFAEALLGVAAAPAVEVPPSRPPEPPAPAGTRVAPAPDDLGAGPPVGEGAPTPVAAPSTTTGNPLRRAGATQTFTVADPNQPAPRRSFLFSAQFTALVLLVGVGVGIALLRGSGDEKPKGDRRATPGVPKPAPEVHDLVGSWVPDWAGMQRILKAGGPAAARYSAATLGRATEFQVEFHITADGAWTMKFSERKGGVWDPHVAEGSWRAAGGGRYRLRMMTVDGRVEEPVPVMDALIDAGRLVMQINEDLLLMRRKQ